MALLFSRLAHSHIKNGYYPTDEETLSRVLAAVEPPTEPVRVIDPCCGEGSALADLRKHLLSGGADVEALGVELDAERAWHAKTLVDRVIHADLHDVVISPRSIGLLFLNPPYGFGVANGDQPAERLEMIFLRRCAPLLAQGGVLVLVVPHYTVNQEMVMFLGRHFRELRFFMAPEQRFAQCVIFGVRDRVRAPSASVLKELLDGGVGLLKEQVLPTAWSASPYQVPAVSRADELRFHAVRLDAAQLADEIRKHHAQTLWASFEARFGRLRAETLRPLRDMTKWHLALALAAGQVTGVVHSPGGRTLLIKGGTHKQKVRTSSFESDGDGQLKETVVLTDRFVPVVTALEFTPGRLGKLVKIQ